MVLCPGLWSVHVSVRGLSGGLGQKNSQEVAVRHGHHDAVVEIARHPHRQPHLLPNDVAEPAVAELGDVPERHGVRVQVHTTKLPQHRHPQEIRLVLGPLDLHPARRRLRRLDVVDDQLRHGEDAPRPPGPRPRPGHDLGRRIGVDVDALRAPEVVRREDRDKELEAELELGPVLDQPDVVDQVGDRRLAGRGGQVGGVDAAVADMVAQ